MLVLFDQGIPLPLPPYLVGHSVRTAAQQGWATLGNGDLLKVAEEADFDVLFTTDKNIRYPAESFRSEDRNRGTGAAAMASTSSPCPTRRRYYSGSHARQLCRSRNPIGIEISVTPTVRTARASAHMQETYRCSGPAGVNATEAGKRAGSRALVDAQCSGRGDRDARGTRAGLRLHDDLYILSERH